jgi:hypothetical protein
MAPLQVAELSAAATTNPAMRRKGARRCLISQMANSALLRSNSVISFRDRPLVPWSPRLSAPEHAAQHEDLPQIEAYAAVNRASLEPR